MYIDYERVEKKKQTITIKVNGKEKQREGKPHAPAFFVSPKTACLLVVYCPSIGVATKLEQLAMLTMTPLVEPRCAFFRLTGRGSCFFIAADCARVARNMPKTLTSRKRWNSLTDASAISAGAWTPICPRRRWSATDAFDCILTVFIQSFVHSVSIDRQQWKKIAPGGIKSRR